MSVVGIDLNSRTIDLVKLHDSDQAEWISVPIADQRGAFFAARNAREHFPRGQWWDDVALVGIEDPYSAFPNVAKALGLVTGAVAALLPTGLTVVQTSPQEWQRVFLGDSVDKLPQGGKGRKSFVRIRCHEHGFGINGETQDALDAFGIAFAVRELCAREVRKAS